MKTSEVFCAISEGMVRTNAIFALNCGASVKKVRDYLVENGLQLVAWENFGGAKWMAVEATDELVGIEFEPENVDRIEFEKTLQTRLPVEVSNLMPY